MIAHELAHIKNHDTLIMTITATIAGAISMIAQFGMFFGGNRDNNNGMGIIGTLAMVILAPIAAMIVQMAISRTREYAADNMGAQIAGSRPRSPRRWRRSPTPRTRSRTRTPSAIPATAHMFIINPLSGQRMDNLFSTHPATENRIAALDALAREMGQSDLAAASADAPRQQRPFASGSHYAGETPAAGPWSRGRHPDRRRANPTVHRTAHRTALGGRAELTRLRSHFVPSLRDERTQARKPAQAPIPTFRVCPRGDRSRRLLKACCTAKPCLRRRARAARRRFRPLEERDRALVRMLAATVLRRLGTLKHITARC